MPWSGSQTMTRHALTENFDNRDVALGKGELVIILENERSGERGFGAGDRYQGGLERVGGYHHVMVKTRHGSKVRIPRHMLSKDMVVFNCQLCSNPALPTYREYVDHMIDKHLRVQLLRGLDMSKKQPTKMKKMSSPVGASKVNDGKEISEALVKLKFKEDELSVLFAENKMLKEAKKELQERMEFYVGQCSEFEKNDSQLQEEISLLQTSIKKSTVENSAAIENLQNSVQNLENSLVFYKDQEEVMIDENEKLKEEVGILKAHVGRALVNEDLLGKYNLKCSMVEELLKKHEKIAAQLRRKDWEIDNYQKLLTLPGVNQSLDTEPGDLGSPASGDMRSPDCIALDLSTKDKAPTYEPNNNNEVKDEDTAAAGQSGVVPSSKRKFSECSSASQSLDDSNPISLHENLDASFDSTSTCPSEAAMLSTSLMSGQVPIDRRRSKSLGGPTPRKIPFVRLEDD